MIRYVGLFDETHSELQSWGCVLGRCSSQAKRGVPEARKRRRATTLSIRRTGPERRALLPRWVGRSYHERHYVTKRRIRAKEGSFSLRSNAPFYFFLSNVESCRSMVVIQASTQQSIDRAQDANLFPRAAHSVLLESAELIANRRSRDPSSVINDHRADKQL